MYDRLFEVVTILAIVSVTTERVVEIIKPLLWEPNPKFKTFWYSLLAWMVATLVVLVNGIDLHISSNQIAGAFLAGLAGSAGSGFWNNILSILKGMKVK